MLTIRFDRLDLQPGDRVLDVGAGFGRHAFEVARRGARIVALDYGEAEVVSTRSTVAAMVEAGEIPADRFGGALRGDATCLPFPDDSFDVVITSEVLEHIQDDVAAIAEMYRVLKPGGIFAVTVPSWLPEVINWRLSSDYHAPASPGGHLRIYSATELSAKLRAAGLRIEGRHRAHGPHPADRHLGVRADGRAAARPAKARHDRCRRVRFQLHHRHREPRRFVHRPAAQ